MGDFKGHAIPGSSFFLFGLWWLVQVSRRYFRCRQSRQPFYATLTFPVPVCPVRRMRDVPVEPTVIIMMSGVGIILEIIGGTNHITHRFDSVGNAQHITMYFFFGLSGVLEILVLKDLAPAGTDYAGMMVALLVEGALFKFHLFGRDELDVLIHTLLLYVIGFTVLVLGLEAAFRKNALLPFLRSFLLMLQGTWFWGVAYILHNPFPGADRWNPEDHHHLMLAVLCFIWHVAVNLVLVIIVGGVTVFCYRNRSQYSKLNTVPLEVLDQEEKGGLLEGGGGTKVYRDEWVGKSGAFPGVHDEDLSDSGE